MKIHVLAVGRMKPGPEKELAERYFDRFAKSGAPLGFDLAGVGEIAESRAASAHERQADEAVRLKAQRPADSALILLDERGRNISSRELAERMASFRDAGRRNLAIIIGGPDGVAPELRATADLVLSFGALTWPHQMVRIMLAEQLYRAATIISGHPYHRD